MKINVLTLFPDIYSSLSFGVLGKAIEKEVFLLKITNIRDYTLDKHKRCDDYPYGGGAGMLMTPQPLHDAIQAVDPDRKSCRIYLSPKGDRLCQKIVEELASVDEITLINGSYEGIDQRIIDLDVDREISVGDYVLSTGDYASLILIDAIARYIPGVLGSAESVGEESFADGLLEYPHYTRPAEFMGLKVPDVLLNGNHAEIKKWREQQSLLITKQRRPDLLE